MTDRPPPRHSQLLRWLAPLLLSCGALLGAAGTLGAQRSSGVVKTVGPPARRTAVPMVLDQPLVCPAGRVRAERAVAHDVVVPALTLTTVRFDAAPLPAGAVVMGRVTWRLRPTSAPNYSAGKFNVAATTNAPAPLPGVQTIVQVHTIGSVPASTTLTALRTGPWNVAAIPAAVLVPADVSPGVIVGFNANRAALQSVGSGATAYFQSQVGSMVQTSFAILETCHATVTGPLPSQGTTVHH